MRVHAVRLGPEYLVFLLIVLFAVPQDGLAACVRSGSVPILTRVTTAINSSIYERWCQSGRLRSIQLLSLPATRCRRKYVARFRVPTFLPLRGLVEEFQSLLYRALLPIEINFFRGNHADRFPSRDPLQLISWPDSVLVGDGSGHCQLQLACDLRHILTLARNPILTKQPAGVPCAANRSSQGPTGAGGTLANPCRWIFSVCFQ